MRPRSCGGEISEIYNGQTIEAMPTPTPPSQRKKISDDVDQARPQPSEQAIRKIEATSSVRFRPNRSLDTPAAMLPTMQPTMAELTNQPSINDDIWNCATIRSLVPEMTNRS